MPTWANLFHYGGLLVNAAFLLVTSAMFVGQPGKGEPVAPPAGKPAPAPLVTSSCGPDCGNASCCGQARLRDRLGGLFNRGCQDSCKPRCFDGHRLHNNCNTGCKPKIWNWNRGCGHQNRAPATCNDPCNRGGMQLLGKLQHCFQRKNACCDGGCSTVGVTPAPVRPGEPIPPPAKKMPVEAPKRTGDVNISNPAPAAIAPGAIPQVPSVPNVEVAPAPTPAPAVVVPPPAVPAPRVESENRAPF
jgi:hypothetical protein